MLGIYRQREGGAFSDRVGSYLGYNGFMLAS
jgi:hypothetical protein